LGTGFENDRVLGEVAAHGARGVRLAKVSSFDATTGLGVVSDDQGNAFGFHSTAISDRSRRIEVGCRVAVVLVAVAGGRFEAGDVTPF
jgi:cold shock CspA family protein